MAPPAPPRSGRCPLPGKPDVALKAEDADDARARFEEAYRSAPFGTPENPVPDRGPATFRGDAAPLIVEETEAPPAPKD